MAQLLVRVGMALVIGGLFVLLLLMPYVWGMRTWFVTFYVMAAVFVLVGVVSFMIAWVQEGWRTRSD